MNLCHTGFDEIADKDQLRSRGVRVHPSAVIARGAEISEGATIGSGACIGPQVVIASGATIGSGAVISGRTSIGKDTVVYPYASVGSLPQDLKYKGEDTVLLIGERNQLREYVNISLGTVGGGGKTIIGNDNLFMVYTHVGHDSIIQNNCIFANGVQLAGHVEIGSHVVFGGLSAAHQFAQFGDYAMVAAGSMASQDVPPFCMVHGDRAKINGLNVVGIRRSSIDNFTDIKLMYRIVYDDGLTLTDAIAKILSDVPESKERLIFTDFLRKSTRGICR